MLVVRILPLVGARQAADDVTGEHHLGDAEHHVGRQLGVQVSADLAVVATRGDDPLDGVEGHQHSGDVVRTRGTRMSG